MTIYTDIDRYTYHRNMVDDPVTAYILILSVMSVLYIYIHIYLSHCNHNYNVQINFHYIYTYTQKNIYYIISHQYPINITLIRFSPCLNVPQYPGASRKTTAGTFVQTFPRTASLITGPATFGSRTGLGEVSVMLHGPCCRGCFGWCLGGALVYRLYGGANGGVGLSVMQQLTSDSAHGPQRGDPTFGRDPAWFLLHRSA